MTVLYDPAGSPFLPVGLEGETLEVYAFVAQYQLGLQNTSVKGDDAEALAQAVAIQVAFLYDQGGNAGLQSVRRGNRQFVFTLAAQVGVSSQARDMVRGILAQNIPPTPLRSLR